MSIIRLFGLRTKFTFKYAACNFNTIVRDRWPPYWPTGRLADNQKMRNLADNLSKMSNKTEAVIGQFKTLFRKRKNIPQFFHQLV